MLTLTCSSVKLLAGTESSNEGNGDANFGGERSGDIKALKRPEVTKFCPPTFRGYVRACAIYEIHEQGTTFSFFANAELRSLETIESSEPPHAIKNDPVSKANNLDGNHFSSGRFINQSMCIYCPST
jgi:hypothetical protein